MVTEENKVPVLVRLHEEEYARKVRHDLAFQNTFMADKYQVDRRQSVNPNIAIIANSQVNPSKRILQPYMQHRKLQKIGHPDLRAYASTNENGYGIVSQSPKNLKVMPDTTQSLEVVAQSEQNNMGNQLMDVESLGGH